MARNVEIKATVTSPDAIAAALSRLDASEAVELVQEDTFFACPRGRLKLRKVAPAVGELIHYDRPDEPGPKPSTYTRVPTSEPDRLRDLLGSAYGTVGVVRKRRTLRLVGRTRVHLDRVEHLGTFVELEVVLEDFEPSEQGVAEARRLMAALGIDESQLVCGAYIDLLLARTSR
jgi:adenylate cyclase class IV